MTIQAIAELVHGIAYPQGGDEVKISLEDFIESAKLRFAYRTWERNRLNKNMGDGNTIDSSLLAPTKIKVKKSRASISHISPMRGLEADMWIQRIGGVSCGGKEFSVMTENQYKLLCDDDSRMDCDSAVIVEGNVLFFPDGLKDMELDLIYATDGTEMDSEIEIDNSIGAVVQSDLISLYVRTPQEDKSNNSNGNTPQGG